MSAAIRAGRAFVELFLKDAQLQAGLNRNIVRMQAWKASAEAMGVKMLGLGAALVTPFAMATKAAGDMAETMSKLKVMFGEGFGDVDVWLDKFSASVGRSKKESADALGAFQAMFVGMGMGQNEAAVLSKEMTTLAVDFGSFHNVTDPESIERFISAFAGSAQVLDMFGINIKESNLNLKLLEMGFESCQGGATELQKILARAEIIRETMGTQGAVGDAIRTSESFSNTYKRVRAEVIGAMIQIGETVMPIFRDLMAWFSKGLKSVIEWAQANKETVQIALKAALAIGAFGAAMLALSGVITVVLATAKAFAFLGGALKAIHLFMMLPVTPLGMAFKALAVTVGLVAAAFTFLGGEVEKTTHAMEEQHRVNARTREDDDVLMQRLQQLAEKQSLSNYEASEASNIINLLTSRYGDLGLSIDQATGKITGMTEAQKKLSEAMNAQMIQDEQNNIAEARSNIDILNRERAKWNQGTWNWETNSQDTVDIERAKIEAERRKEYNRMQASQNRLNALTAANGQGPADLTASEVEKRVAAQKKLDDEKKKANEKAVEDGKDAAADLAKIEDDRRRESLTPMEREIDDARRRGEERQSLRKAVYSGEAAKPNADIINLVKADWANKERIDAETQADIAAIKKKAAEDEAAKAAEARAGQLDEIARKELDLKFAAKAGETEQQAAQREHQKRLAMIDLEQEQALRNAKDGLDPELIKRSFDADRALAEANFGAQGVKGVEQKINSVGSFNAAVVGRIGQDSIDKQQLEVAKIALEVLKKIEKKESGLEFGNGV